LFCYTDVKDVIDDDLASDVDDTVDAALSAVLVELPAVVFEVVGLEGEAARFAS
jgi:hypothetical protein